MVQLSSPSPDIMPVQQQGKSPDKAPGLKNKSDGFKTAFRKEKEIRESDSNAARKTSAAKESGKSEATMVSADKRKVGSTRTPVTTGSGKKVLARFVMVADKGLTVTTRVAEEKMLSLLKTHKKTKVSETQAVMDQKGTVEMKLSQPVSIEKDEKTALPEPDSPVRDNASILAAMKENAVDPQVPLKGAESNLAVLHTDIKAEAEIKKESSLLKLKKKPSETVSKITVEDKRTATASEKSVTLLKEVDTHGPANRMTFELVPSEDGSTGLTQGDQMDTSGKTFSIQTSEEQKGAVLLDRQLNEKGTQELTKNIRFVLKDNKEGEIKLILKPESLGKVRINLNLQENNIVGKIIVENNSVRQAFMNNLADLTKALEDSGFSSASLDVSVGGGQADGRQQYREEKPVYFNGSVLNDMDGQIPVVYEEGLALSQINLVV